MSGFENLHTEVDNTTFSSTNNDDLINVLKAVKDVTDWEVLATLLGISHADYTRIVEKGGNINLKLVQKWLELGQASWSALVKALCDDLVKQFDIARAIEASHPRQSSGSSTGGAGADGIHDNPISKKSPEPFDAFNLLRNKSADWEGVARGLQVSENERLIQRRNMSVAESTKLDNILNHWVSSYCSPVTWGNLYEVVKRLSWIQEAQKIKEYVCSEEAMSKYGSKPDWRPLK